jgi:hypothetical protein
MEVYTLKGLGSCDGLMDKASAWTLLGNGSFTHGENTLDALPIPIAVTIQPNDVQSFYIVNTDIYTPASSFKAGTGQYGQVYASNSDLQLIARGGVWDLFGDPTGVKNGDGRLWQGTVNYCVLSE